jgi:hypothetical protein
MHSPIGGFWIAQRGENVPQGFEPTFQVLRSKTLQTFKVDPIMEQSNRFVKGTSCHSPIVPQNGEREIILQGLLNTLISFGNLEIFRPNWYNETEKRGVSTLEEQHDGGIVHR